MVKNKRIFVWGLSFALLVLLVFFSTISANYAEGENKSYELSKKKYGPEENVQGWVNISFKDEPVDSVFSDNDEKEATIKTLLNSSLNSEYNYTCDFQNCEPHYATTGGGGSQKSYTLNKSDPGIFGIKLDSNIDNIDSVSFDISSNAPANCTNQIEIDLFADDEIDMINTNKDSQTCEGEGDYGCFDKEHNSNEYFFDESTYRYCQKINITTSTGAEVGANMKNDSGSTNLTMKIYDMNGNDFDSCNLPYPSDSWEEINCGVEGPDNGVFVNEEPYYVCIEPENNVVGDYLLKGYTPDSEDDKCGSTSISPFKPTQAYQIFAKEKGFGNVDTFTVEDDLENDIENYIKNEYGSLDCSSNDCVIPIKVISNVDNQDITIENLDMKVEMVDGGTQGINNFYKVEKFPAKINSDYGKFYFDDGGFLAPEEIDNFTFKLDFEGEEIIYEELEVVELPHDISLSPLETASVIPTEFSVSAESAGNITSYFWDFGDNNTDTTTENTVSHTYDKTGNYTVTVNVTDEFHRTGSESFDISVSTPKESVESMLSEKKDDAEKFESELSSYDSFKQNTIKKYVGFESNNQILEEVDSNYTGDNSDEEINNFAKKLIDIKIPSDISETSSGPGLSTSSNSKYINPDVISSVAEEDFDWDQEQEYIRAIEDWNTMNLNNKISYEEYTVQYNGNPESYNFFTLSIIKTPESNASEFYFFIENMDSLELGGVNSSETSGGDYFYERLSGEKDISIATKEDIGFEEVPYFISPKLSEVNINDTGGIPPEAEQDNMKWVWYIAIVIGLAIVGIVIYYFLQRWYDKKYEDALFKDKNKLYNLANYVTRAKNKGMENSKIRKELKDASWSGEQIRYVMRKYAGKRTGLPRLFGNLFGGDKPKNIRRHRK